MDAQPASARRRKPSGSARVGWWRRLGGGACQSWEKLAWFVLLMLAGLCWASELAGAHHRSSEAHERADLGSETSLRRRQSSGAPHRAGPSGEQPLGRWRRASRQKIPELIRLAGQRLQLECPLIGGAIRWRKDGGPELSELVQPRVQLKQTSNVSSLSLMSAQIPQDEGLYECAKDFSETDQSEEQKLSQNDWLPVAQVRLLPAPRVAPFEFPADALVGMRLLVTCSALQGQSPISFVWFKDGNQLLGEALESSEPLELGQMHLRQLLAQDSRAVPSSLAPSEEALPLELAGARLAGVRVRHADQYSLLSIEPLSRQHSGSYTCSIQNRAGRASHSARLVVNAPPSWRLEPRDADLVAGQWGRLDCQAEGQPAPAVNWLRAREGRAGPSGEWLWAPLLESSRLSVASNGSLLLSNASQLEQGRYLCQASNGFGPELTKVIRIRVHEPAHFLARYKQVEVRLDERASIECSPIGEPPISIHWLDPAGNQIGHVDKRFILEPMGSDADSRLILARSGRPDSGHYTCQAWNKYGTDKMVANLLVLDVPDPVGDLCVTNATASTVSLRWRPPFSGNSPINSYLVQYQSDDPLDELLTGAAPTLSASTSAAPPSEASTSAPGAAIRAALEALSGRSATNSQQGSSPAEEEAIDRTLVELSVEVGAANGHLVVRELSPHCVYRFRLAAVNKLGLGPFADWIRAKTEEAPPSGSPLKLAASATGPNSVKLSWWPPERRQWNGPLTGFILSYRPLEPSGAPELNRSLEWTPAPLETQQQLGNQSLLERRGQRLSQALRLALRAQQQELVAHLTNLQRATTYLVWVRAVNGRGQGPQSMAVSVRTLDDVPPSAPQLQLRASSAHSLTLAWSLPGLLASPANQYSLFFRRLSPASPAVSQADELGAFSERQIGTGQPLLGSTQQQQFVYTLDGLECGALYELYMSTRNSVGKSEPSTPLLARTQGEPPLAPHNRAHLFQRISATEAALNLASWSTGGCPLTQLSIRYRPAPPAQAYSTSVSPQSAASSAKTNWPVNLSVSADVLAALNAASKPPGKQASESALFLLKGLQPATAYELEISAQNAAGHSSDQYEIVTANANGSRPASLLSRRDGLIMYRAGGEQPFEQLPQHHWGPFSPSDSNGSQQVLTASRDTLLPLLLLLLCLLCLILSSTFCYFRLADSWRRRQSGLGPNGSGKTRASCHYQQHQKPDWRPVEGNIHHYSQATLKLRQQASQHQAALLLANQENSLHLCGPRAAKQTGNSPEPAGFGQSVSMKDFRSLTNSSSLKLPAGRADQSSSIGQPKSSTLRPERRLLAAQTGQVEQAQLDLYSAMNQVCSVYSTGQPLEQSNQAAYARAGALHGHHQAAPASCNLGCQEETRDGLLDHSGCSLELENNQRQQMELERAAVPESSAWNGFNGAQMNEMQLELANQELATKLPNYAIPVNKFQLGVDGVTTIYGQLPDTQAPLEPIYEQQQQSNIDACIRHLMEQQYQHQQQQQYAMIVNHQAKNLVANGSQSILDCSSSSSGIDTAIHQSDCLSTSATNSSVSQHRFPHGQLELVDAKTNLE